MLATQPIDEVSRRCAGEEAAGAGDEPTEHGAIEEEGNGPDQERGPLERPRQTDHLPQASTCRWRTSRGLEQSSTKVAPIGGGECASCAGGRNPQREAKHPPVVALRGAHRELPAERRGPCEPVEPCRTDVAHGPKGVGDADSHSCEANGAARA